MVLMKSNRLNIALGVLTAAVVFLAGVADAGQESYSPYASQEERATKVFWGDTHLHTDLSIDGYTYGTRLGPDSAYRFARGEPVVANNGMNVRLRKPLDFLVIADHAEGLGLMTGLESHDPAATSINDGRLRAQRLRELTGKPPTDSDTISAVLQISKDLFFTWSGKPAGTSTAFAQSAWHRVIDAAEKHNDPGRFTAFIGYEWTSPGVGFGNLHRVVIFRDGAEKAKRTVPFSAEDSRDPEALWDYLANYERSTGGEVLAIPHNGNLSNGQMFSFQNQVGQPLSRSYAQTRNRWEPIYEVTQTKGTSETHPTLSPTDEFANFEIWNSWFGKGRPTDRSGRDAERALREGEYARSALKRGLTMQSELGINPFKFGLIGSTDAHTSLSAVEENNFWGTISQDEPNPRRILRRAWAGEAAPRGWQFSSAGYAAVWATENSRSALFDAMKRRETYATTGPRIVVRFFGGWDYVTEDRLRPNLALIGYQKGVPMGGDLTHAPSGKRPRFLIHALKDPDGANLDRVQLIKGWRDLRGQLHEKVYDVAFAKGRRTGTNGKLKPVGNTVDVSAATYLNKIGVPELSTVWEDRDFDPREAAFYYVRVLEIPTPRWTAHDAKFFGVKDIPPDVPMVLQERAYTSPIWYTPRN